MTARRTRGDGSLFFDASRGVWTGSADAGRDPETGRRIRRKVSAKDKQVARRKLEDLRKSIRDTGTAPRGDLTVEQVMREVLAHPPSTWQAPATIQVNTAHCNRVIAHLGNVKAARLTAGQVEGMLRSMAAGGYSTKTIKDTRAVLRLGLRRAMRDHGLGRNVAGLADIPHGTVRKSRSMTLEQVGALLGSDLTPFWRGWLTTAIMCGLRPGELAQLRWENVDYDAGVLRVRGVLKTESSHRTIRMPAAVVAALQAWGAEQVTWAAAAGAAWRDTGLVFTSQLGCQRDRRQVASTFKAVCGAAGIGRNWQPRETRHTFVSVLSDRGVDIEQISDAVGHINSHITKSTYRHQIRDEVQAAAVTWDSITTGGEAAR